MSYDLKSGRRTERVSWIAALNEGRIFAPLKVKGSSNTHLFESWVSECLVPQLIPGQVIIMDNASFHKSSFIVELIEGAGCELWYLPKYSPDLNKIERWWFVLKNWMKQRFDQFEEFWDCVDASFKNCPNVSS